MLNKFSFLNVVQSELIPMDSYHDLRPVTKDDRQVNATWYREVIGLIIYAMVYTRPDIAFALRRLSQYMQDLVEHYAQALKCLLYYL